MKNFAVYRHPTKEKNAIRVVKVGFSWPAFFFGPLWAFLNDLNLHAIILFIIGIILNVLIKPNWLNSVALIGFTILIGLDGNERLRKMLEEKGYKYITTVEAKSLDHALRIIKEDNLIKEGKPEKKDNLIKEGKPEKEDNLIKEGKPEKDAKPVSQAMTFPKDVTCPHCNIELELEADEQIRGKYTCPNCGQEVTS